MNIPALIAELSTWEGVPFHHQGRSSAGVDCAGLIVCALAALGIATDVPRDYTTNAAGALLLPWLDGSPLLEAAALNEEPQAGDVLAFRIGRSVQHLGVAIGDGSMVHAIRTAGVATVTLSAMWRYRLAARYRWADHG